MLNSRLRVRKPKGPSKPKGPGVIFRWAGSKARCLDAIMEHLDGRDPPCTAKFKRFISPFVGAGSVEFEAMRRGLASEYILGDSLPEIQVTLRVIQDEPSMLKAELKEFADLTVSKTSVQRENKKPRVIFSGEMVSEYLRYRQWIKPAIDNVAHADRCTRLMARRFLILQACAFNGLWRVNSKGQHNVPFGRPASFDFKALTEASQLLQAHKPQILCQYFSQTIELGGPGDLVYADPPYLGAHSAYTAKRFGLLEHTQLLKCLLAAKARGAECWVSGSNTTQTTAVYGGEHFQISARQSIGCKTASRGVKRELLVRL